MPGDKISERVFLRKRERERKRDRERERERERGDNVLESERERVFSREKEIVNFERSIEGDRSHETL